MADTSGLFGISGQTWQGIGGAAEDISNAAGSLFGGIARSDALQSQAQLYGEEANYLTLGEGFQEDADFLKYAAEGRRASQEIGAERGTASNNGLKQSGTVLDLVRESVTQANFEQQQQAVTATSNFMNFQGQITAANMEAEAASKAAQSAMTGGIMGAIGGVAKGAFALAGII